MSRWIQFGLVVGTATAALAYHWLTRPTSEPQSLDTVESALLEPIAVPAATVVEPCASTFAVTVEPATTCIEEVPVPVVTLVELPSKAATEIVPDVIPQELPAPSEAEESLIPIELISAPEPSSAQVEHTTVESNAAPVVAVTVEQTKTQLIPAKELYKDQPASIRNKVKMRRRKTPKKEVGSPVDLEGSVTNPELSQSDSELGSSVDPAASLDPPGESALVRKVRKRRRAQKKKDEVVLLEESVVDAKVSSNDPVPVVPVEPPIPAIVEVEDEAPTAAVAVESLSPSDLFSAPASIDSPVQQYDNTTKKSEHEDDVINTMTFWNSSQKNQQMTNWEEYFTSQKMIFLDKLSITKSSQNEPVSDTKVKEEQATSDPGFIHPRSENPQVTDWREYFTSLKKNFLVKSSVTKVVVAKVVPVEKDDEPDQMLPEVKEVALSQGEREILMNDNAVVVPHHRLWDLPIWKFIMENYSGEEVTEQPIIDTDTYCLKSNTEKKVIQSMDNWADCDPFEE